MTDDESFFELEFGAELDFLADVYNEIGGQGMQAKGRVSFGGGSTFFSGPLDLQGMASANPAVRAL